MNNLKSPPGKVRGYALLRNASGEPMFKDIDNIPGPIWDMLTKQEQENIKNVRNS